jgi:hypothetical protein
MLKKLKVDLAATPVGVGCIYPSATGGIAALNHRLISATPPVSFDLGVSREERQWRWLKAVCNLAMRSRYLLTLEALHFFTLKAFRFFTPKVLRFFTPKALHNIAQGERGFASDALGDKGNKTNPLVVGAISISRLLPRKTSLPRALFFLALLLLFPTPASAGLHYSGEQYAELPSRFRGFLVDYRALCAAAIERPRDVPVSPLREDFLIAAERLEKLAKTRALTADENADLGALCIRLGKPDKALGILLQAARKSPEHFRLAANLGTAFQVSGDLERAAEYLEEAIRLAPEKLRPFERYHLKLVRLRIKEGRQANNPTTVDDLFGVKYVGESGNAEPAKMADAERKKMPADAVAAVEQLLLWLPADGRLLWQLGELANVHGDVRTAAAILDGCVAEFAMSAPDLRKRRQLYRAAADEQAKKPEHEQHKITFNGKSSRPLLRAFDESSLPAIKAQGVNLLPWQVLAATTIDAKGRPMFMKYLEQLDGKTVTLTGFMQPVRNELSVTGFLMLEYPVGCWFCETPEATGLINVELKEGKTAELRKGLVKVTGTLSLNRTDPETYLFNVKEARIGEAD